MSETLKLIVGLGNPGPRYQNTKHNVGFWVINELLRRNRVERLESRCKSLMARVEWEGETAIFAKPMTYMNRSGEAVAALVERFEIAPDNLCIVYDDIHLDFGVLRIRRQGSDGGHNGMKSISGALHTQAFPRLRVGIGEPDADLIEHVLTEFSDDKRAEMLRIVEHAADAVETLLADGIQMAMSRFNGRVS